MNHSTLSDDELNRAIAKALGWTDDEIANGRWHYNVDFGVRKPMPSWATDEIAAQRLIDVVNPPYAINIWYLPSGKIVYLLKDNEFAGGSEKPLARAITEAVAMYFDVATAAAR